MKINLKSANIKVSINNFGAYVETFTKTDEPIFFPKVLTKIGDELKARGGMYACIPNFSNDEITGLPKHGFARDMYWDVLASGEDYVDLKLQGEGAYEGVYFYINYKIDENKFITSLNIYNRSDKTVNLGPGFHPYFYCKDLDIEIEDFPINNKQELMDTIFLEANKVKFRSNGRNFEIRGDNVGVFAIWTDFNGDYICVEPTYKGRLFTTDNENIYKLKNNEEFTQEFIIEIV